MLRANYTDEDRATFQQLRYSYPDERIMRRFEILWLHSCGKFAPEIATLVQQNAYTVRDVIGTAYDSGTTIGRFSPPRRDYLRSCDINRSKTPWKYCPYTHKTKKRGKSRELAIGPKARAILTPYLDKKAETPEAFLFSPIRWILIKSVLILKKSVEKRRRGRMALFFFAEKSGILGIQKPSLDC